MNKDKLTYLCHKIGKENNICFNDVIPYYFMENVLKKISKSRYRDIFVYKGGYLLSCTLGINSRTTKDIDVLIDCIDFDYEIIYKLFDEILKPLPNEEIEFYITNINSIKNEDRYGGFRVVIMCKFYNIRQKVSIDVATGDAVTPFPVKCKLKSIFDYEEIQIKSYNLKTILAEKIQTIFSKNIFNSRCKDFYDLYIIYKMKKQEIDLDTLKVACINTFAYRNTNLNYTDIISLLEKIKTNKVFIKRWNDYSLKNQYTNNLSFDEVIGCNIKLIIMIMDNQ